MASCLNSCALNFEDSLREMYSIYPQKQMQNGCIILLMNALAIWKNINFAKHSFYSPFDIPYLHMLLHDLLIWDGFLFEFKCLEFWRRLMWNLFNLSAETGAVWAYNVVIECISNLKNINFAKPSLDPRSIFPIYICFFMSY